MPSSSRFVLDDLPPTDLPVAIRHLRYEPVADTSQFENALDRVVRAVLGQPDKPALGPLPAYASASAVAVSGLDRIDILILKTAGDEAVRTSVNGFVLPSSLNPGVWT